MSGVPTRGAAHLVTNSVAFALVTTVATLMSDRGPALARAAGAVAAFGLGLTTGTVWALVTWLAGRGSARVVGAERAARFEARFARFRRDAVDRDAIVSLHALIVVSVLGLAILGGGLLLALRILRSVQDVAFGEALATAAAVAIAAGVVGIAAASWGSIVAPIERLDARFPLPLPPSARLRAILWPGVPLIAGSGALYLWLQKSIGPFAIPFACVAAWGVARSLRASYASLGTSWGSLRVAGTAIALFVLGVVLTDRLLDDRPGAVAAVDASALGQGLLRAARGLTDVDRDGTSSLFGGGDCAPLDKRRRPGVVDVPQNGVDEDCTGSDTNAALAMPTGPRMRGGRTIVGRKPDIVWFVVDAIRADHVSFLGYDRETTPNLEALAAESLVFERAWSQSSATMLSFPSFLTGLDPGRMTWRIERGRLQVGANQPFVAERLEALGYRTGFVASDYFTKRLPGLLDGWSWRRVSEVAQTKSTTSAAAHAAQFVAQSLASDQPFFLVVYMEGPHSPYVSHGPTYPKFGKKPIDLYDQEIAASDRYIGFILDLLRSDEERWQNTVVVFNSDHGEEFGEHGGTEHARTCHAESVHVPLLIRIPDEAPARVDVPVGLIDVVPTLIELSGGAVKQDEIDGHSLLLARHDPQKIAPGRPFFCSVVSQRSTQGNFFQRAVRSGKWVAMQELRGGQELTLFDAEADPGENRPVEPDGEAAEAKKRLGVWLTQQLTSNLGDMPIGVK